MENRSFFIEATLQGIDNIFGITDEIITTLRSLPGPKVVLKTFPIPPADMNEWIKQHGGMPKGIEYDIAENSIAIKVDEDAVRAAIRKVFKDEFFPAVIDKLFEQLPNETFTISYNEPHTLEGDYSGDIVASDGQIDQEGSSAPRIVLLIGAKNEIFWGARKWILGNSKKTKFVIGIEVIERPPPSQCPWDLSVDEIVDLGLEGLASHIHKWHKKNRVPIVGVVKTRLFVFTKEDIADNETSPFIPSWTCTFGPHEPYVDNLGNHVPAGIFSELNHGRHGIELPGNIVVNLPFGKLEGKINRALAEFEKERALLMATEGENWAFMTKNGGAVVPPFPV